MSSDSKNKNCIVIIDDEIDLLVVFKKALELSGLIVSAFADPFKALDEFKVNYSKYDLVMFYIHMPGMYVYELINQFKKINPNVKVIFVTAQDISKSDIISKLNDGVSIDEIISKPVSLDKLNQVVQSVINNS